MRRHILKAAIATGVLATSITGYSYSTFARWASVPVTIYANPANADVSSSAAATALQYAMNVWNAAGSSFRFQYGGNVTDTSTGYDNRNVAIFRNATNGSAIATTYSWWDSGERLLDSDIIVWDGGFRFYTGTSGCGGIANSAYLEDIATHEFGHVLGLGHSSSGDATMYPSYSYCSQAFRTLSSDDIAGVRALYPATSNTAPTVTIMSPANGASFTMGATISLAASASDAQDGNLTSQIQWTDNGAAIGSGGLLSRVLNLAGVHVLVARVTDSGGLQASSQVTITVTVLATNTAPSLTITSPANGASYVQNSQVSFTASASDSQDGNVTSQIQWTDNGVAIGSGGSLSRSMTTTGSHVIVARVTDSGGLQTSRQVTVTITPPGTATSGTLSANRSVSGGMHRVALTWSGLSGALVDLYRNGTRVTTTSNDGDHNDRPGTKSPTTATYTYRVCSAGTATCTNTVSVSF